jgi:hypothetical protein
MKNTLLQSMEQTTQALLQTIDSFTQNEFNIVPFEGSWTAAQVAEHLLKSESGLRSLFLGNTAPSNRPVDKNVKMLQDLFLDFSTKLQSPPPILPSADVKDKDLLYKALATNRAELTRLANTIDLTQTFTDYSFPTVGQLTGIEWLTFVVCHSKRHIHQLNNIKKHLHL